MIQRDHEKTNKPTLTFKYLHFSNLLCFNLLGSNSIGPLRIRIQCYFGKPANSNAYTVVPIFVIGYWRGKR